MEEAERIAREEHRSAKLAVIAGSVLELGRCCVVPLYLLFQALALATTIASWATSWMVPTCQRFSNSKLPSQD